MHMRIDQARQHVQTGGVEHLVGGGISACAQRGDTAIIDANIDFLRTPRQYAGAVTDQQVEMRRHWGSFPALGVTIAAGGRCSQGAYLSKYVQRART